MASKDLIMQSAAGAQGNGTAIDVEELSLLAMQVTGTFSGTVTFEGTIDDSTWVSLQVANVADGAVSTTTTAPGVFQCSVAGLVKARARVSAWASGTITVQGFAVDLPAGLMLADIDVAGTETVTIAAGTADIGIVTVNGITITQTPAITAGAYSAADNVGGLLTFANAARVSTGGGVIKNVLIVDDAGQDAELELWLFDTTFTAGNDNDAWAPTEAQLHTQIAVISTEDSAQGWIAGGTPSVCDIEVARRYDCTGTSLFGRLVTRGTPTYVATDDLTVRIMLLQD